MEKRANNLMDKKEGVIEFWRESEEVNETCWETVKEWKTNRMVHRTEG